MPLPDKDALLGWIKDNPRHATKRDIARAFGLKGHERIELKRLLRELAAEGAVEPGRKRYLPHGHLPPVAVLRVSGVDADGDLLCAPQSWDEAGDPPPIRHRPRKGEPALAVGDRVLCKLHPVHEESGLSYESRLIRRLPQGARRILGVYRAGEDGAGTVEPVEKGADLLFIPPGAAEGAQEGELVEVELSPGPRRARPKAQVVERLGDPSGPRALSLIAIHQHEIPTTFPEEALAQAEAAEEAGLGQRDDLRHLPLLTIDPADARDHDDAVCALPDEDPANPGGWRVWVAIADVAAYVPFGSALDRAARQRGNSTYFPDRVVPMLPERLSADLCSLHQGVDRPVIAVEMILGADGAKRGHRFARGLMRSPASLAYEQAQALEDSQEDEADEMAAPVRALFSAYRCAAQARDRRAPLHLDLPERRIVLSDDGEVQDVAFRERLEAHRLIEEFMILANVCAAEELEARRRALLYRVHEEPSPLKLDALREQVETVGLSLPKGQVLQTRQLNRLLDAAQGTETSEMVSMAVLRAQTQAYYFAENFGHFGLNLRRYAHFTSPIRRYADLVVHRALIAAHGWAGGGAQTPEEVEALGAVADHISKTERRSMEAERDTNDRYLALFLADRLDAEFKGRVSGVGRFGLFVKLDETGADGLVPISSISREYWRFDAEAQRLVGGDSGTEIGLGAPVSVRLTEVAPVAGGLRFELLSVDGEGLGAAGRPRRSKTGGVPRKAGAARAKTAKIARKRDRRRRLR